MKLKKLLKVLHPYQAIRLKATTGTVTKNSEIIHLDNTHVQPLLQSLGNYKVVLITSIYDPLQLPDHQYYLEITLIGGNDNDKRHDN